MFLLTVCDPKDLRVPSANWTPEANFTNGVGNYSFSGGNVTFDGVSLRSTATYTTNAHYHIIGSDTRRCLNNGSWTPSTEIIEGDVYVREEMIIIYSMFVFLPVCLAGDLLSCNNPTFPTNNTICCNGNTLCSTYTGLANGSTATYITSQDCLNGSLERTCVNMSWSGQTPTGND